MGLEVADQAAQQAPAASGLMGWVWWKLVGIAGGVGMMAALAAVIVMCMSRPRDTREWVVALVSTVISSVCGGAFVIRHYGMQMWLDDWVGTVSVLGIVFACGLPGWTLIRVVFNTLKLTETKTIPEVVSDVRAVIGGRASPSTTDDPQEQP